MSKELPILFSGPMVRAILEGSKTQTRQIMNPQPKYGPRRGEAYWPNHTGDGRTFASIYEDCPYGQPGDRFLVSGISLELEIVRVEMLQDISEDDARAEGASAMKHDDIGLHSHVRGFQSLWESINGTGSWDANPWVWVITFKRLEP